MCISVIYRGESFDTRGDLRRLISQEPYWMAGCEPIPKHNSDAYCLCGVDHRCTAAVLGCRVEDDGMDVYYLPVA